MIGCGKVMPDAATVHGYQLTDGWVSVMIMELHCKNVECWEDYPTMSGEVEVGSFEGFRRFSISQSFACYPMLLTFPCVFNIDVAGIPRKRPERRGKKRECKVLCNQFKWRFKVT